MKWATAGNSITLGPFADRTAGWRRYLLQLMPHLQPVGARYEDPGLQLRGRCGPHTNGYGGQRIDFIQNDILATLDDNTIVGPAGQVLVLFSGGTNDLTAGFDPVETANAFFNAGVAIAAHIRVAHCVCWVPPRKALNQPNADQHIPFEAAVTAAFDPLPVGVSLAWPAADVQEADLTDGIHPGPAGNLRIARGLAGHLERIG